MGERNLTATDGAHEAWRDWVSVAPSNWVFMVNTTQDARIGPGERAPRGTGEGGIMTQY